MDKQIMVPVTRGDRVSDVIPFVERVAHPGMKVVFLLRYPLDGFIWRDSEEKKLGKYYTWEWTQQMANQMVLPFCNTLRDHGVEVVVRVYAGSLRKVIRSYALEEDLDWIIQRAGVGRLLSKSLNETISILRWFKRPSYAPVLLTPIEK